KGGLTWPQSSRQVAYGLDEALDRKVSNRSRFLQGRISDGKPVPTFPENAPMEGATVPLAFAVDQRGILPDHMIAALAKSGGIIPASALDNDQIQPASLDLRLGEIAYRVRASFLPGPRTTVAERIDDLKLHEFPLADGAVLETGCVYIVPLLESRALPDDAPRPPQP